MIETTLLAVVLLLQPLVFVLYAYVAYRAAARFTSRETGDWVDTRIDRAAYRLRQVIEHARQGE